MKHVIYAVERKFGNVARLHVSDRGLCKIDGHGSILKTEKHKRQYFSLGVSDRILAIVEVNPELSCRRIAAVVGCSLSTVLKILLKRGYHPYKPQKGILTGERYRSMP